ncbi:MAG: hypothetical protein BWY67_02047 [Bacteroidetes bacterium ADurb.Bin397]|nr:MAG: hypothetical protein BWY67_02047 [Bacteroidetes bacterium ADurb.Bin397]
MPAKIYPNTDPIPSFFAMGTNATALARNTNAVFKKLPSIS